MHLDRRQWFTIVLVGLIGQLAWTVENMYLNVYIFETITDNPAVIAATVAASAVTAGLTTILVGPWSDRLGMRRPFISGGYILWGLSTAAFGLIAVGGPLGLTVGAAIVAIIALDCIMTVFGSSANDAAYQSWVTDVTTPAERGRVDSVVQTLPLISMLVVFVLLDPLSKQGHWLAFFAIVGAVVTLVGIVSHFLVRDRAVPTRSEESYAAAVLHGLRPSAVRERPLLYLTLGTWALWAISSQVYMPFLLIYLNHYLRLDAYALVLGGALIIASILTMAGGRLIDRLGKGNVLLPVMGLYLVGLLVFAAMRSTIPVLLGGALVLTGMLLTAAALAAITRDQTPADRVGQVQGLRMILTVMVPMVIGPFLGAAVIQSNRETYVDLGVTRVVPTPAIFIAAAVVLLVALVPAAILRRRLTQ
jgi:MFS family permease